MYEWNARVHDYDAWLDRKAQRGAARAAQNEGQRIASRQLRIARLAQEVGEKKLKSILGKLSPEQAQGFNETQVNANQAARLMKDGIIIERLVTGESTERVDVKTDYSKLSDEELAQLDELDRKSKGAAR
jgi:hypothetical protein